MLAPRCRCPQPPAYSSYVDSFGLNWIKSFEMSVTTCDRDESPSILTDLARYQQIRFSQITKLMLSPSILYPRVISKTTFEFHTLKCIQSVSKTKQILRGILTVG